MPWADEGLNGQLTIGQRLGYENDTGNTNTDEGLRTETTLGLRVTSETRTQKLEFSLDGALRYALGDTNGRDRHSIENPTARLSYTLESRNSRLSFDGSYRRNDVDETVFLTDDLDPDNDIITGGGTRTTLGLRTTVDLGRNAPLSTQLTHFYGETRYSDTTDASLVDTETQELGVRFTYQIDPAVAVSLFANRRELDAAGPGSSDRNRTRYGVGLNYAISPSLTANAELSYSEIETDNNAGTVTKTDGINTSLGLNKELQNGTLSFDISEEETVNGKRRQLQLSRNLEYSRGTFGLTLGLSKTDGLDLEPLVSATATYNIDPSSQLSLNLSQASAINDDNEESVNTRLSLGYSRELSALSNVSAQFSLIDRNALTVANEDQTSTRIDLSHRYELSRGFNMVSSYRYSKTKRDGQADSKKTVFYLGLEKTFDFRP